MIKLIPTPKNITELSDKSVEIPACIHTLIPEWQKYADVFANAFELAYGVTFKNAKDGIELCVDSSLLKNEYIIETSSKITVSASDGEGVLYALASLMQLLEYNEGKLTIPRIILRDYPDKEHRGIMVDLGRYWHPFEKLLKFVDICFLYKIKYLNLHFIDNKLYTLPSHKFPNLPSPGMHYSFEQIEILNQYAKDRGVVIVPEYECPGHASVFNRAYPEIFSDTVDNGFDEIIVTECGGPIGRNDIICAGSDECTRATFEILKEICDMFPESPYINIGGDEAPVDVWDNCSVCRKYMEENRINSSKELYGEYVGRICKYILSIGKTPIVWEGFPKESNHFVPKETIVVAWESHYQMPCELIEAGFRVINSSWQPLYIVKHYRERWDPRDILKWNVYNWQHWWKESEACLNPVNVQPTDRVIGSMMCAWEMNYEQEINFIIENLAAMSERVWNVRRVKSDEEYFNCHLRLSGIAARIIQDR